MFLFQTIAISDFSTITVANDDDVEEQSPLRVPRRVLSLFLVLLAQIDRFVQRQHRDVGTS